MSYVAMKIGRNDGALAHALAKREAGEQMDRDIGQLRAKMESHTGKRTMKAAFRQIRAVFGARVIHEIIVRPQGSRAKGLLFVMSPLTTGDMVLFVVQWERGTPRYRDTPIVVSHHAVARMMQRTVRESDLPLCIAMLRPYVLWAAKEVTEKEPDETVGMQMTIAGAGGALVFRREGDMLIAKTWLDADMMADPKLKEASLGQRPTTWWEAVSD